MEVDDIKKFKGKEKITVLTCYDASFASILEAASVDLILVGDSLGNVVLGYDSTQQVTMQDMLRHTHAVRKGAPASFIVADMPYRAEENAFENAHKLMKAGADAVKLEGLPEVVNELTRKGIPVMGHIGHLPQTAVKPVVHRTFESLLKQARQLEDAGAFAVVLEMVQTDVAKKITESISIPTIGIGAGPYCDGQVLVLYDMLGLFSKFKPKFVKRFGELGNEAEKAIKIYISEVKTKKFPSPDHSFD
ncbi:MAG TPA: 3-methyl-2-oxobutanoate hydroxymethyltransferase [Candidatus Nanoarchaeia archaeon]|nr:3-methyl-2-oxobutanoate hydroxymethyltransferase [Candidatus Nanoarchaeia archaeon]